jgi:LysR family transcriptional regulator, glycine cleavage system transcriptional activator
VLHDHDRSDWPLWFAAQGVTHAPHLAGPSFNDLVLLVRAAVAGQGVALVPTVTVERELKSGALVRALKIALPLDFAYWLVCPTEAADRPKAAAFRAWVLDEAAADRAAPPRGKRKRKSATLKSSANERGREDRDRS